MFTNEDLWIFSALIAANLVFFFIPLTIIIRRMGFSGWWILLVVVPLGILVGPWLLVFARWPALVTLSKQQVTSEAAK